MTTKTKFHRDGTITYWSVYRQQWVERSPVADIPDRELAAWSETERTRANKAAQRAQSGMERPQTRD